MAADSRRTTCLLLNTIACDSSSKKNCDNDKPKASQIFDREGMEGKIPFRYHDEMVDCVNPDFSASWYSLQ